MTAVTTRKAARSLAVAGLLAATALTVGACGAGQISQTANQVAAVNGNQANVGQLSLRNVRIDYPRDPKADSELAGNKQGGRALLMFDLINNSPDKADTLTSITTDVGTVQVSRAAGDESTTGLAAVPAQQTLVAGREPSEAPVQDGSAGVDNTVPTISVEIDNLSRDLTPGLPVRVTFGFQNNGAVTLGVPVDAAGAPRLQTSLSPGDNKPQAQN
jgi:hypothetical protein